MVVYIYIYIYVYMLSHSEGCCIWLMMINVIGSTNFHFWIHCFHLLVQTHAEQLDLANGASTLTIESKVCKTQR